MILVKRARGGVEEANIYILLIIIPFQDRKDSIPEEAEAHQIKTEAILTEETCEEGTKLITTEETATTTASKKGSSDDEEAT